MSWRDAYRKFRDGFAEALDPRFYTIEWLDGEIEAGRALLWSTATAAIVAEVREYPTGAKVIHSICAAGDLEEIQHLIARAESWASEAGCMAVIIESRDAWARILKPKGYYVFKNCFFKDL